MRIEPAELAFDASGTPFSPRYGDVYHSADSGPGQARHVFLGGNSLPERWAHRTSFTVLELGFGLGINFLATWQAWKADARGPERLHYVSIEKHPFGAKDLAAIHARHPELEPLGRDLRAQWPLPLAGMHRLFFERQRLVLTLFFGDAVQALKQLRMDADAIYLDGFSPERNADMWNAGVMKRLARLAHKGTTLATYSTAGHVRAALAAAGFEVEKKPGFGQKREMLCARSIVVRDAYRTMPPVERSALLIGAGLAGSALAERLSMRGWDVRVLERHSGPAQEASGLPVAAYHPHVSRDDSILSRWTRAGFLDLRRRLESLGVAHQECGVLQMARRAEEQLRMHDTAQAMALPHQFVRFLDHQEARALAGVAVRGAGWGFGSGGWLRPADLVSAAFTRLPAHALQYGRTVARLDHSNGRWVARSGDGTPIASAPVAILANACSAAACADFGRPFKRARGQMTCLPAGALDGLKAVLAGPGLVVPAMPRYAGATYDFEDEDPAPRAIADALNLERIARMIEGPTTWPPETLQGCVGFRCVSHDRLPLAGQVPDTVLVRRNAAMLREAPLAALPRREGLYALTALGSRGVTWSGIAAELLASQLDGEPWPVEADLAAAVDPARFVLSRLRRGTLPQLTFTGT